MKARLILLIIVSVCNLTFGQKVMTFDEAKTENIRTSYLDSIYPSGIHSDTSIAVFKNNQEKYITAYQNMLQDFGDFLKKNDFLWEKPVRGFNKIYFNNEGKVDFFIFSFRSNQLSIEQETKFKELLIMFIEDYKFPLSAETGFAQCSPVTYMP